MRKVSTSPGPRSSATAPVAMSTARAAVLATVREEDRWCAVKDLADRVGQHTNTVREHLDALVEAGLVRKELAKPQGRGRPALMYRAVAQADGGATPLAAAAALARQLVQLPQGAELASAAGRAWAQSIADDAAAVGSGPPGVVETSRAMGFDPHPITRDHLVFRACPMLAAARSNPAIFCALHAGLIGGLAEANGGRPEDIELSPLGRGGCLLEITRGRSDAPMVALPRLGA